MAKPIEIKPRSKDAREELQRKLANAPVDHAAALLSGYELLQQLHDTGTLDTLRGLFGAGDVVVNHVATLATEPETVTALRNLLILGKLMGSIDPELLHGVSKAALGGERVPPQAEPPSLFAILRRFASRDSRRALSAAAGIVERTGRVLAKKPVE